MNSLSYQMDVDRKFEDGLEVGGNFHYGVEYTDAPEEKPVIWVQPHSVEIYDANDDWVQIVRDGKVIFELNPAQTDALRRIEEAAKHDASEILGIEY